MQASDPYTLLLERVRALEVIVANLRDELAEFKTATYDLAVVCGKEKPEGWIGGTDE